MKKKIVTLIKFIILVAIFYALLVFNIFNIGEKLVPTPKDYIKMDQPPQNEEIEQTYLEINTGTEIQTWHFAANTTTNLETLCMNNIVVCDKIHFNGKFTDMEKYNYIKPISKTVEFIDNNGNQDKDIKEVIGEITINKEIGDTRGKVKGRDTIIFNIGGVRTRNEFMELSTHEIWHITDLWYIQWISSKKDKNYTEFDRAVFKIDDLSLLFYKLSRDAENIKKAIAKAKDFCSGYGMTDPFEDFAECFNLYTNHNSFFRQIAKVNSTLYKKYNFIAGIFDGQYINANKKDLDLKEIKNSTIRRPRDTTKISN